MWCGEVRVLEKPVFFGGRDSDYGNSILNNFLPENAKICSVFEWIFLVRVLHTPPRGGGVLPDLKEC